MAAKDVGCRVGAHKDFSCKAGLSNQEMNPGTLARRDALSPRPLTME